MQGTIDKGSSYFVAVARRGCCSAVGMDNRWTAGCFMAKRRFAARCVASCCLSGCMARLETGMRSKGSTDAVDKAVYSGLTGCHGGESGSGTYQSRICWYICECEDGCAI